MGPLPPIALYVHVPFCVAHCPYCDFTVYAGGDARGPHAKTAPFHRALATELELRADALDARFGPATRPPLRSVYFGGGTPSLTPPPQLAAFMESIRARYGVAPDAEVTLEANPGPDERGDAAAFRAAGVTRISYGAQSMDAAELRRLGRRHSPSDVAAAVRDARDASIGSINLDLLYDVPGQTMESWRRTLEAALALEPDHLSVYALTLDDPDAEGLTGESGDHLPTSSGARRWRERAREDQDDDRAADQYALADGLLRDAGYRGYEISNWARPGHESVHNLVYWHRAPYEAAGPGAHAFDGETRRWNAAALGRYLVALQDEGRPSLPPGSSETIDDRTAASESAILALRLDDGVPADRAALPPLAGVLEWGIRAGLLEPFELVGQARFRLTLRGRLLSNELFSRLV